MKAISLWQPWASLMAIGAKRIETRSWSTTYRGWLAIHAAKVLSEQERVVMDDAKFYNTLFAYYPGAFGTGALRDRLYYLKPEVLPRGCIVAVVNLAEVMPTEQFLLETEKWPTRTDAVHEAFFGDYSDGRFAWITNTCWRLDRPIPCRGRQQLWDVPADVLQQIKTQLGVKFV